MSRPTHQSMALTAANAVFTTALAADHATLPKDPNDPKLKEYYRGVAKRARLMHDIVIAMFDTRGGNR